MGSQGFRRDPMEKSPCRVPDDKLFRRKSRAKPDDFRNNDWKGTVARRRRVQVRVARNALGVINLKRIVRLCRRFAPDQLLARQSAW